MNFARPLNRDKVMEWGDLVVIYESHDSMDFIFLESEKILNNKFGSFYHSDFVGKVFGSKVSPRNSSGWIYALHPTPELWSLCMNTRTQIVDELDASVVTFYLDLYPGCVAVESGTGSGNMTLSLARAVWPSGKVHSFEYNKFRADEATAEFKRLHVDSVINVTCSDVCGKIGTGGFVGVSPKTADAVFLDLPDPWLAIDYAFEVLKPGKKLCSYSPCIEQVAKTCVALRRKGFHSIYMIEVRQKLFDGRVVAFDSADLGRNKLPSVKDGNSNIASNSANTPSLRVPVAAAGGGVDINDVGDAKADLGAKEDEEKMHETLDESDNDGKEEKGRDVNSKSNEGGFGYSSKRARHNYIVNEGPKVYIPVANCVRSMKGHTAFLTFATCPAVRISEKEQFKTSTSNEEQTS